MPSSVCDARAARARSFPGTLEPGRLILAERRIRGSHQRRDRESARPPRLHQGEPGPDRVVERSLHVAGDDRVPFLRRGAHRPRSIGATLDGGARRRSRSVDPAASRARSRAGDDPRGVRRQERPVRGDPRRARDVRLSPRRAIRLHAAAVRVVPRRSLPAVRPVVARGRARADRRRRRHGTARPRDRRAAALPWSRPRRRAPHDASPVRRLARRPRESRGARRARTGAARAVHAARVREPLADDGRRDRLRRGARDSRERQARLLPSRDRFLRRGARSASPNAGGSSPRGRRSGARRRALGRTQQGRGRLLRDHDRCSRAVEGEQPGHARRARPRGWIDDVPELPGAPPGPSWRPT